MFRCSWLQLNCFAKLCDSSRQLSNCRSWSDERYWYMPWSSCCANFTVDAAALATSICIKPNKRYHGSNDNNFSHAYFCLTCLAILRRSTEIHLHAITNIQKGSDFTDSVNVYQAMGITTLSLTNRILCPFQVQIWIISFHLLKTTKGQ